MSELSRLSQTILDYAMSRAKRNWAKSVDEVHLVAALRHWDESWFDGEFPGVAEKLNKLLEIRKGDSLRPESVDPKVMSHLEPVKNEEDAKELARDLVESLRAALESAEEKVSEEPSRQVRDHPAAGGDVPADSPVKDREQVSKQLQLTGQRASHIAELLGRDASEVLATLQDDARHLGVRLLGRDDPAVAEAISFSLGDSGLKNVVADLSDILRSLVNLDHPESSRTATQLALAYVDIAEFAASLDDKVTEQEIEQIDAVRLECREILAGKIDATSDAIIEFEQKFSELIGMEAVKKDLRKRVDFLMVAKRRAQRGRATEAQRMHMAFIGNPGTGKTTVARLFGQLLNDLELLPSDVFVEKDRSGLVGTHVGHTEEKTKSVVRQAEGGVLFIDEAYALNDRYANQKGFGEEAVDVLVKEMEDKRDRLVVILAGYKEPMAEFLEINPGLKSRIPSTIEFPDYSTDELLSIADRLAQRRGLVMDEEAVTKLRGMFDSLTGSEGFGNAREVENVIDAAQRNLTMRLSRLGNLATDKEGRTIVVDDIPASAEAAKTRPIGFARQLYL
jgi:stage V sporulation protein K